VKDIVPHEKGILSDPVPGGVEVMRLKRFEHWLNAVYVKVAMLPVAGV
jgi:hypothetical protein